MNTKGFTFIEIIVSTGIIALVMFSVIGILAVSFKSQNRVKAIDKLNKNAIFALGEMRRAVINSAHVVCPAVGVGVSSFDVVDGINGENTKIVCNEGSNIASESANRTDLTGSGIVVSSCDNFALCSVDDSDNTVSGVEINFTLGSVISGLGATKSYTNKITIR